MRIIEPVRGGKHCYVIPYKGKALKIFNYIDVQNWKPIVWGDKPSEAEPNMSVPLDEATIIQNISWLYGLAPRVYEIVKVVIGGSKHWGQLQDYLEDEDDISDALDVYKKVKKLGIKYGWSNDKDDVSTHDVLDGKLVDFNTFHFVNKEKIKKEYIENARYGKIYYHNIPELGLTNSPRQNDNRIGWLGLDKVDFKGKTYADFGCAGGHFVRYAKQRGAKWAVGYDSRGKGSPDPVKASYLVSFLLGQHDIDYYELDLSTQTPEKLPDIGTFLSMNYHIPIPLWLKEIPYVVFEDNSKNRDALPNLLAMFNNVKQIGVSKDHGDKPIYRCTL